MDMIHMFHYYGSFPSLDWVSLVSFVASPLGFSAPGSLNYTAHADWPRRSVATGGPISAGHGEIFFFLDPLSWEPQRQQPACVANRGDEQRAAKTMRPLILGEWQQQFVSAVIKCDFLWIYEYYAYLTASSPLWLAWIAKWRCHRTVPGLRYRWINELINVNFTCCYINVR